ncbi:efflux RND transporter periplasmic adaptor subunit [endosymbiont of Ridgeia piscesae]|jgi:Cu(I)/Ag(I) efflux system membrane fusion protein|uniref:RND family efflux transporter, MFP subunit n=1 Tax=endosymbiont of Ridgeia piscesae TaxID=54398 RepID=A0A0T5Z3G3_9GAMM|nr:efflux RND transporter periplasmic adaptor subunit [endosymbiont of Ridgeia piscesae]KRT55552.1 RND family efflux transporter, MFP subunit [endosymbiont of Ridgeia piscesae]KRT57376.1 RND family efflux transporter, MFP subunit [endosymbiont of Ridgeia piscesae]
MKTIRIRLALLFLSLIISSANVALAQQIEDAKQQKMAHSTTTIPVQTATPRAVYVCPMHPDETSREPGNCSICGMFLVEKQANSKTSGMSMQPGKIDTQHALDAAAAKKMPSEICVFPAKRQTGAPADGMVMTSAAQHNHSDHQHAAATMVASMSAPQATYVCPMHPNETSHKPGNCSICGMFLVESTAAGSVEGMEMDPAMEHDHAGHQHDPTAMPMPEAAPQPNPAEQPAPQLQPKTASSSQTLYVCPMHPNETSHEPGRCSICGMFLVESTAEGSVEGMEMDPTMEHDHAGHQHAPTAMPIPEAAPQPNPAEHPVPHLRQQTTASGQTLYVCPMHPQIVAKDPGSCPICGMDLEPVEREAEAESGAHINVSVSPEIMQSLGIRTARLQQMTFSRTAETMGYIEYDKTRMRHVYAPANGNVENLSVRSEGERVQKGQFLFKLFTAALSDYYDDTFAQLDDIVVDLPIIEGQYVMPTTKVMTLADLSSVWVLADVFESQASWIRRGQQAEVRTPNHAGRVWRGEVEYIYPSLDPETRTLKVRMRFDNPDEALIPNMLAEITIHGPPQPNILALPKEALIQTGHQQRVILALGDGHFQPHPVQTGQEFGDWIEITAGLTPSDEVVVSGQFLIDSEASLKGSLARLHTH